ncbi:MAG: hypothetical protein ACK5MA_05990 [Parachlamydiaceae bacterium]
MKTVNVTFSIPENINIALHRRVEKRGLSRFVTKAIEKALTEKHDTLKAAFRDAENDPNLKETMDDWAALDGEEWDA